MEWYTAVRRMNLCYRNNHIILRSEKKKKRNQSQDYLQYASILYKVQQDIKLNDTLFRDISKCSKERHWKENKNQCNIYLREKVEDGMVGGDGIGERHNKELQYSCQFSIL